MPKMGKDYRMRDDIGAVNVNRTMPIELLDGEFSNVIYSYQSVSITDKYDELTKDFKLDVKFSYQVLDPFGHKKLDNNPDFRNHIALILEDFIFLLAGNDLQRIAQNGQTGKDDSNLSDDKK